MAPRGCLAFSLDWYSSKSVMICRIMVLIGSSPSSWVRRAPQGVDAARPPRRVPGGSGAEDRIHPATHLLRQAQPVRRLDVPVRASRRIQRDEALLRRADRLVPVLPVVLEARPLSG